MNITTPLLELEKDSLGELRKIAEALSVPNAKRLKKEMLLVKIRQMEAEKEGLEVRGGILEVMNEGIGFLRSNYQVSSEDIYVSQAQLRRFDLRSGDLIIGNVRPPRESERHYGLLKVESINGLPPDDARRPGQRGHGPDSGPAPCLGGRVPRRERWRGAGRRGSQDQSSLRVQSTSRNRGTHCRACWPFRRRVNAG